MDNTSASNLVDADLTNEELLIRFKDVVEDAYYHHNSEDQEDAKKELSILHQEIIKRMT
jgi:hypothetical protein